MDCDDTKRKTLKRSEASLDLMEMADNFICQVFELEAENERLHGARHERVQENARLRGETAKAKRMGLNSKGDA